jgi:hypothetical protein
VEVNGLVNTQAYYDTATISALKSFIVQVPGSNAKKHYSGDLVQYILFQGLKFSFNLLSFQLNYCHNFHNIGAYSKTVLEIVITLQLHW